MECGIEEIFTDKGLIGMISDKMTISVVPPASGRLLVLLGLVVSPLLAFALVLLVGSLSTQQAVDIDLLKNEIFKLVNFLSLGTHNKNF